MSLVSLAQQLHQHGVQLDLTPEGRIRPRAEQAPPAMLIEAIRAHRALLVRRLERGQTPDGRLDVAALQQLPGRCGCCQHWRGPDEYGDGLCILGRAAHGWLDGNPRTPVITTPHHQCAAREGLGWLARSTD